MPPRRDICSAYFTTKNSRRKGWEHHPNGRNIIQTIKGERSDFTGDFTNSVAIGANHNAVGTVKLKDMRVEISGHDVDIVY